ncbi:MAG: ABC transporter ATP-binding protein [Microbacteriaceae bacterium]
MNTVHGQGRELLLQARNISRTFKSGAGEVHALKKVTVELASAELLVVRGPSGSGKTTLLNILGSLDKANSGEVWLGEHNLNTMKDDELAKLRSDNIGFIFQTFGLVPVLSAQENVELPLRIQGLNANERVKRATEALELVGLGPHRMQRPYELSGGQQQRVGIARALAANPKILIADEPTGQLDSKTAESIIDLIISLVRARGMSAIISTHAPDLMARADRILTLRDGEIVGEE